MLGALKDNLASLAAKSLLAGRLERYGQLVDLRIHSRERTIMVEMLLAGEEREIRIDIGRYRTAMEGGKLLLVIESVSASREWLQLALKDFLVGQPIPVPSIAAMALGKPTA